MPTNEIHKMKDSTGQFLLWLLLIVEMVTLYGAIKHDLNRIEEHQEPTIIHDTVYVETPSKWDSLISALIDVESNGNPMAVNASSGASGVLQITEIYLRDVNRILKEERYSLDDRFDADKSVEMFMIIQNHYNPERDIDKAIRMHNPGGGDWYYNKVKSRMI